VTNGVGEAMPGYDQSLTEEERWAVAAFKFGWAGRFLYQVPVGGGSSRRGGVELDFLFFTIPSYTPIFIDGFYWHSANADEAFGRTKNLALLGIPYNQERMVVWDYEIPDQELTDQVFLTRIGQA